MNPRNFLIPVSLRASGLHILRPLAGAVAWRNFCTANSAAQDPTSSAAEMRLSAAISTANIASVANGDWALIAPYGDHPSPGRNYVQHLDRVQAEKVVENWNSLTGVFMRRFKNMMHGLGTRNSVQLWDGHPDYDNRQWPKERLLGELVDVRAGEDGLEGQVIWNTANAAKRQSGPLYPSAWFGHWPVSGEPPTVYPETLLSIGLVPTPNISGVPAWTANAAFGGFDQPGGGEEEVMTEEQTRNWAALRAALGLPETADAAAIINAATTANAAVQQLTERDNALTTANSARTELETKITNLNTQLTTANSQVTTLTTERDNLQTANSALTGEVGKLRKGLLDLAEKKGAFTPAERATFETKLSTANSAEATIAELQTRKALNTTSIEVNGSRLDLSTANSRQEALQAEVTKRLPQHDNNYNAAYAAVKKDPTFAPLFDAMQDPTKAK